MIILLDQVICYDYVINNHIINFLIKLLYNKRL